MPRLAILIAAAVLVLGAGAGFGANQWLARDRIAAKAVAMTGGDPDRGRADIKRRGCGGCHQIPGVAGAKGSVGPPLTKFATRVYIAGRLNNTPDQLTSWIGHPHGVDPKTAMPEMGVGAAEARDIAAYLYTLQ
jgi:cytochrome c